MEIELPLLEIKEETAGEGNLEQISQEV